MSDFPVQEITIYHKNDKKWDRYVVEASFRHTSVINHSKNGTNSSENALIRIFDTKGYNFLWFVAKGDVIVNKKVEDEIEGQTPLIQLKKVNGDENVFKVTSIDKFIFEDCNDLQHIKLGCI